MTTPMMNETRERAALADLQGSLIELIDLSLTAKQAHWNVVGESFKPVHLQLDEIYDVCRLGADEVAERIATLGGEPEAGPGQSPTTKRRSSFQRAGCRQARQWP